MRVGRSLAPPIAPRLVPSPHSDPSPGGRGACRIAVHRSAQKNARRKAGECVMAVHRCFRNRGGRDSSRKRGAAANGAAARSRYCRATTVRPL